MALPPEKISELKQIIHNHLTQLDIQSSIRNALAEALEERRGNGTVTESDVLAALRQKGVLDDIMRQLHFESSPTGFGEHKPATHFVDNDDRLLSALPVKKANVDPTRRYLFVQFVSGRAFLEHLSEPQSLPGQTTSTLTLHINFRSQRFKSRPSPCACEPDFQEGFLLELHKESAGDAARMIDVTGMMSVCDPIHVVLVKTDPSGDTVLVSSCHLEWRSVLAAPNARCTVSAELMGIGSENKVPVGVLEVRLELIPRPSDCVTDDLVTAQVSLERAKQAERERLFLVYAKQWWKEFLQIRPTHSERLVKIFAQDENGTNRPVCWYVRPLRAGRLLDTPRQAARFVSLVGYEKTLGVGGGTGNRLEQWSSTHAFLCRNKGDCEDHVVLLCSLLLGFGVDAYVCVGTKSRGAPHAWVMTIASDGLVTFWESLTGHRYIHRPVDPDDPPATLQPRPEHPYRTVGCVFNHEQFFANCQPTDHVELCVFELYDESRWKAMSPDAVRSVCDLGVGVPNLTPLCGATLDGALISNQLEQELKALVTEHRRDQGLMTVWDDNLSYLLTPALSAYETERLTGVTAGNEEFQQAIRRAVPDGHTFKGYPVQFVHRNARRAFNSCLKSPVCEEIINCRGDHMRLAVRVRVYTYPENTCATWLMFACKYKSVL